MSSTAHVSLKKGMMVHALNTAKSDSIIGVFWDVCTNPWVMAWLWLGEEITLMRLRGMLIIILGVLVLAKAG